MSDKAKTEVTKDQVFEHIVSHLDAASNNLSKQDYATLLDDLGCEVGNRVDALDADDDTLDTDD